MKRREKHPFICCGQFKGGEIEPGVFHETGEKDDSKKMVDHEEPDVDTNESDQESNGASEDRHSPWPGGKEE